MNTCATERPSYFIVDWPLHGRECYELYLQALGNRGLQIDIEEMMDWGCMAIQQIGHRSSMIPTVVQRIYFASEDLLPRCHDQESILELITEIVELIYTSMQSQYGDLFEGYHRRVWVREASDTGLLMEVNDG